ncbi:hypothetical protein X975_22475, partial [Stegodyphus mimosarum]
MAIVHTCTYFICHHAEIVQRNGFNCLRTLVSHCSVLDLGREHLICHRSASLFELPTSLIHLLQ